MNLTGQPLQLKYPLRFLDAISTPEKLIEVLDDLSTVGWIGSKLPKTNYIMAAFYHNYDALERHKLYTFSPEWKQALLQWFYDNQDSTKGFWGPRFRYNGEILNEGDIGSTYKIIQLFSDKHGNNIHPEFPLRYQDEMLATILHKLSRPAPDDANAAEIHDWKLARYQGIKLLTDYLWKGVSADNKNEVKTFMERMVKSTFETSYLESEGAFCYYPDAKESTLDGTNNAISLLDIVGALSKDRQKFLWGSLYQSIVDLGSYEISEVQDSDLNMLKNTPNVNSIRFYQCCPAFGNFTDNVVCINYPKETKVLDVMDLLPRVKKWVNTTPQNLGNWTSKEAILQKLSAFQIEPVPVFKGEIPLILLNEILQKNRELTVIGFDVLQIPNYKVTIRHK